MDLACALLEAEADIIGSARRAKIRSGDCQITPLQLIARSSELEGFERATSNERTSERAYPATEQIHGIIHNAEKWKIDNCTLKNGYQCPRRDC
jgi:hypothetical protein